MSCDAYSPVRRYGVPRSLSVTQGGVMQGFALRRLVGGVATAGAVLLAVGVGAPAQAAPPDRVNVVPPLSDQAGRAPPVGTKVGEARGLALAPPRPPCVAH